MFMFRSRRNGLLKRLWRHAVGRTATTISPSDCDDLLLDHPTPTDAEQQQQVGWIKLAARALFKRMTDDQLAALLDVVEGASSGCLLLDSDIVNGSSCCSLEGGLQLLCRIFRWPDMPVGAELKRMVNVCRQPDPPLPRSSCTPSVCCNPYHWCRLSDVAPPPYTRLVMNLDRPGRLPPNYQVESMETNGTNQYSSSSQIDGCGGNGSGVRQRPWCTLAYWELRQRVGRLFPVTQPSVAIFSDVAAPPNREADAAGLCLGALTAQRPPETDAVRRTRQKVGLGLMLCQEPDGVWMYNRSENPVFVNSPTLDPPGTGPAGAPRTLLVYKVPPDFAIRVFDHERSLLYQQCGGSLTVSESLQSVNKGCGGISNQSSGGSDFTDGPFDPNALRISFAKGWGPKYSRQFITSCPCWIEVLLAPPSSSSSSR